MYGAFIYTADASALAVILGLEQRRWLARFGGRSGNQPRRHPDETIAKKYKRARWALLKNPGDLTDEQV